MTTNLTPPPATAPEPAPPAPPRRSSARVVSIVAICLGGALALGTLATGTANALWSAGPDAGGTQTADVDGIQSLRLDVEAGDLVVAYGDVEEAELDVPDGERGWSLTRDGDTLHASNSRPWWASWRMFDWGNERVVLTLPLALEDAELDADLDIAAGSITASGSFGELVVSISAGDAEVSGSATDLQVDLSAGRGEFDLADVTTGDLHISAGDLDVTLTGSAPSRLGLDVSAGSMRVTVPDATYRVFSDVSAGNLDNGLRTASDAARTIQVDLSAGSVSLRPGR